MGMVITTLEHGAFLLINTELNSMQGIQFCQVIQTKLRLFQWDQQVKSITFFLLFFSGDIDYIKSISSVSTVRPLQYTGA